MSWDYRLVALEHDYGRDMPDVKDYHYHIMEVTYRYDEKNNVTIESMIERDSFIDCNPLDMWEDLKLMIGAFKKPILDKDGNEFALPVIKHEDVMITAGSDMEERFREAALEPLREWYKSAPFSIRSIF